MMHRSFHPPRRSAVLQVSFLLFAVASIDVAAQGRTVAVTFDDLPGVSRDPTLGMIRDVNVQLLRTLSTEKIPAIGFVNENKTEVDGERDARVAILKSWLDTGMELGNHTYSHPDLNNTPLEDYEEDTLRGEAITRPLLRERDLELRYFRHPFTHTGPTAEIKRAFELFLAERGYRIAPFTIEDVDYVFAALYDDALSRDEKGLAERVRVEYLTHQDRMFEWFESLSRETFGREIPQILLIHVNRLNADAMPECLRRMRSRGYDFVALDDALRDEAYATPDRYVGKSGPSWLHRFRVAKGAADRLREEPDPATWILQAFSRLPRR